MTISSPVTVYRSLVKHKIEKSTSLMLAITAAVSWVVWIVLMIFELEVKGSIGIHGFILDQTLK